MAKIGGWENKTEQEMRWRGTLPSARGRCASPRWVRATAVAAVWRQHWALMGTRVPITRLGLDKCREWV